MSRTLAMVLSALLSAAACCAAEQLPIGPSPQFGLARIADGGSIEITEVVSRPVWETRVKKVPYSVEKEVNGRIIVETRFREETYQVCKFVSDVRVVRRNAGEFRVVKDGAELDAKARAELLKELVPVVLVTPDQTLDRFYVRFFKAGTVVVYLKSEPPVLEPEPAAPAPRRAT